MSTALSNNGMQRSADIAALIFIQSFVAPADARRWVATIHVLIGESSYAT
jgi:hypothetical protein